MTATITISAISVAADITIRDAPPNHPSLKYSLAAATIKKTKAITEAIRNMLFVSCTDRMRSLIEPDTWASSDIPGFSPMSALGR